MRPLLKSLTDFWDTIRTGNSSLDIFANQDYMRGLIAGVRVLLEKSNCLTRDSAPVKKHDSIRKSRKLLLSELSILVKIAKRLSDYALGNSPGESVADIFDEMLLKAFKVVTRGVRFLDTWNEEVGLGLVTENANAVLATPQIQRKLTSTVSGTTSFHGDPTSNDEDSTNKAERGLVKAAPQAQFETIREQSNHHRISSRDPWYQASNSQCTASIKSRPASLQTKRMSLTHRMSYTGQTASLRNPNLASEQLDLCYDTFLGVLGSFLGLHMQSRSSSELLLTTQQSVKSCRELLTVIEVVLDHDLRRSDALLEVKDAMYDKITELVHAAREAFSPVTADEDSVFLPEEGKSLVNAATACVRGAGECVAKTRMVLEQIGDFELESVGVRSPTVTPNSVKSLASISDLEPTLLHHIEGNDQDQVPPIPTRLAPQIEILKTIAISLPEPLSDLFSPISTSSLTLFTPDSTPSTMSSAFSYTLLGPIVTPPTPAVVSDDEDSPVAGDTTSPEPLRRQRSLARDVVNSTGSGSTYLSSTRNSRISLRSQTSTRATSPDQHASYVEAENRSDRFSGSHTTLTDDLEETEQKILEKTYAHELMCNKERQVIGGTLRALIEKLTAHDSTPDALFVSTFYLTFRLFTTPMEFAEALASRFDYVGESPEVAGPVRLRVYNIFKGWLESHWRHDCDDVVMPFIVEFAQQTLLKSLPTAGKRLTELAEKVKSVHGHVVPRLVSSIGKTNTSIAQYFNPESPMPPPIISRSQLAALRSWKASGSGVSILDFDPLELARQITLKESSIFCSILPEELLATEWNKRSGSLAVNVRAMSTLSTDLANLVADSVLQLEEPKRRAALIKHWVKIASKCLDLNNYDTLMAIICSLNSSTISRLKKTWEVVSQKTKATLENLRNIVDVSRNYAVLRNRLQNHVPPCLPFVGTYLTDLTFVDHGNQATRKLDTGAVSIDIINYDKHVKTAKVISELQRFQIPYRLTEVPELQTWMQDQLVRVRSSGDKSFQNYYRRSLLLEPREQAQQQTLTEKPIPPPKGGEKDRFDFLAWAHPGKDKSIVLHG
jgi:RasGEF domain/RasGEF N-terminal motif